jgi:hypothetical protein
VQVWVGLEVRGGPLHHDDGAALSVRDALLLHARLVEPEHGGSHAGAEPAAIAYSVCATCSLLGINPVEYLGDVLPRLARGVSDAELASLMPAAWKAARVQPAAAE